MYITLHTYTHMCACIYIFQVDRYHPGYPICKSDWNPALHETCNMNMSKIGPYVNRGLYDVVALAKAPCSVYTWRIMKMFLLGLSANWR